MNIKRKITINKPADEVWQVLGAAFDKADEWMSAVPKSYAITEGTTVDNAPVVGRVCELSNKANGPYADERILIYDKRNYRLQIEVVPQNADKLPVIKNIADFRIKERGGNACEVSYDGNAKLKFMGKLLYPMLKAGLGKSFTEILEELKHYVETGIPHPRKIKAMQKAKAA